MCCMTAASFPSQILSNKSQDPLKPDLLFSVLHIVFSNCSSLSVSSMVDILDLCSLALYDGAFPFVRQSLLV